MTTTLVAHRDTLVAHSLRATLDAAGLPVLALCHTAAEVATACQREHPDVVVTSAALGDGAVREHMAAVLRTPARVLLVCDEAADDGVREALLAGASGCLPLRDSEAAQISEAVHAVAEGQAALHPSVALRVLQQWRTEQRAGSPSTSLTAREREVLHTIGEGLTTAAAARTLGVATKTVEAHKARIFAKLGARNQAEAVATANRHGLLPGRADRYADRRAGLIEPGPPAN